MKYPDDFINKVICGDCLEVMKQMPDKCVDLVVTSPPYNKNGFRGRKDVSNGKGRWQNSDISYGSFQDDLQEDEYQNQQIGLLNELHRAIKGSGSIFYNHKERRANNMVSHPLEWVLKTKAKYWQEIIWNRLSGVDHNINYLSPVNELIFWLVKEKPKVYKNGGQTTILDIVPKPETRHPAPFPEKLVDICILLTTDEGDTVLDPYFGSGTVGVSCKKLNRNFVGIEINEQYCKVAEKRLFNTQESLF